MFSGLKSHSSKNVSNLRVDIWHLIHHLFSALLKDLEPVGAAIWNNTRQGCLQATRVKLLGEIRTWIDSPSPKRIYWLNGLAGTGKSTIAGSVCEDLDRRHQLCISFFISRKAQDLRSAQNVVHTIAYQLAMSGSSQSRQAICRVLQDRPDLFNKSLQEQVSALVTEPLRYMPPLVLVIDALDECETVVLGRKGTDLLSVLADSVCSLAHVKLFVTSRNEDGLRKAFANVVQRNAAQVVQLHEIEKSIVREDIRVYLAHSFAKIIKDRADDFPNLEGWPLESDLTELLRRAGVLFVYAVTVINFVSYEVTDPTKQLKLVMDVKAELTGPPFKLLDELYTQVLANVPPSEAPLDETVLSRLRSTLGALVFSLEPLRVHAIVELTGRTLAEVNPLVRRLAAVVLGGGQVPVSLFHPSFLDFVTSSERCHDTRFLLRPSIQHQELAYCCLRAMNDAANGLRYNICGLADPYTANQDVADLDQRLQRVSEAVRYAAVYWAAHLSWVDEAGDVFEGELVKFCENHLFHWIELLSLLGRLSAVVQYLPGALLWCQVGLYPRIFQERDLANLTCPQKHANLARISTAEQLLRDAWRMSRSYQIPIASHALHVYHSALAMMPECHLQRHGRLQPPSIPRLISSRQSNWGPDVRILEGHHDIVRSAAFSPDGQQIVSGSHDETVRVWNAQTGDQLAVLEGHISTVTSASFSPDGQQIVSGSEDGTVRVWNAQTGDQLAVLEGHIITVTAASFSPDGQQIVSGSRDSTVRVWNAQTGDQLAVLEGHSNTVISASFSPDGQQIVSGSNDGTVRVWNTQTGDQLAVLQGHSDEVTSASFSPDGQQIVSSSYDKTVRVWNAQTGYQLAVLEGHSSSVKSASFSFDGQQIVSGSVDRTVRVWNTQTGDQLAVLEGHSNPVMSASFSPDGQQIVSGSWDKTVRIWNTQTGDQLAVREGHSGWVISASFSPDGQQIVSGSDDKTVRVWNAQTGHQLAVLEGHIGPVASASFSPDGRQIVSGSFDHTICIWNAQTGHQLAVLKGHSGPVMSASFSFDGQQIVSGSVDRTVRVWNAQTGDQLAVIEGHSRGVISASFSPDGQQIVSGSLDKTVRVWNTQTGDQPAVFEGHNDWVISASFSPDGQQIVSGSWDNTVRVWNAHTGDQAAVLEAHSDYASSASFSPDGQQIVSGCWDNTVRVWNAHTGDQVAVLEGHSDYVSSASFSPDGQQIVSSSGDKTVRVWNAQTGHQLAVLKAQHIVSEDYDGNTCAWCLGTSGMSSNLWDGGAVF
jgi:WD40 repeat protein/cytidylate kinase